MTKRIRVILRASVLALLAIASHASALEVANVRSGLACNNSPSANGSNGWICQVTEEVLVTDQGECHFNGETRRCTWVGVEFDYRDANPGDELTCTLSQSKAAGFGNPAEEIAQGVRKQVYKLKLPAPEGRFYNPQYFAYSTLPPDANRLDVVNECRYQDVRLFEYRFRLRFPTEERELPKPLPKDSVRDMASLTSLAKNRKN